MADHTAIPKDAKAAVCLQRGVASCHSREAPESESPRGVVWEKLLLLYEEPVEKETPVHDCVEDEDHLTRKTRLSQ